jgi:hypothetical protein
MRIKYLMGFKNWFKSSNMLEHSLEKWILLSFKFYWTNIKFKFSVLIKKDITFSYYN